MKNIKYVFSRIKEKGLLTVTRNFFKYMRIVINSKSDSLIKKIVSKFTKNMSLKDYIVIESHNDFDCNGGAFYDYLIKNNYNKNYKIVWLVKHKLKQSLPNNVIAFNIHKPSFKKNYYISIAKYLTCDDIITEKVRNDQISLYLTHGAVNFKNVRGLIKLPESIDFVASASENYDPINCNNLSLPYPNKKMMYLGYPCHDILFSNESTEIKKITAKKYNKVFLWMPTFRKSGGKQANRNDSDAEYPFGIPMIQNEEELLTINDLLKNTNSLLIIKIHPMQDPKSIIELKSYSNLIVLDAKTTKEIDLNIYGLMKDSDALISDYSSSPYSFLLLNRPIAFTLSDIKEYKLSFDLEKTRQYLTGHIIFEYEEFLSFIKQVINGEDIYKDDRTNLLNWLYKYKDGNSCQRIVEFLKLKK